MMLPKDWLKFYRNWSYDELLQEIVTCHKYQNDILLRVGQKLVDYSAGLNMVIVSQAREDIIQEVIREKVIEQAVGDN